MGDRCVQIEDRVSRTTSSLARVRRKHSFSAETATPKRSPGFPRRASPHVVVWLVVGLVVGLDAWLYHHWLTLRLYRRSELPRKLSDFLVWCAEPSRGWIRITHAYEFRHRGLLDYLAVPVGIEMTQVGL